MNNPYNHTGINSGADFDGTTYRPELDKPRLTSQLKRVYAALSDGRWHTLKGISLRAECPEASASSRLRDLRKLKFGSHTVDTKRGLGGLYYYRLKVEPQRELF